MQITKQLQKMNSELGRQIDDMYVSHCACCHKEGSISTHDHCVRKGILDMMAEEQRTAKEINEANRRGEFLEDDIYIPECEYCDGTGREADYELVSFDPVHRVQTEGKICFSCGGSGRA